MDFSNGEILHVKGDGIEYIQFKKLLELGIKHAYTLKKDGIDFSIDRDTRKSSFQKICKELNLNYDEIVQARQSHTDRTIRVDKLLNKEDLTDVDGLITDKKGVVLATTNADCILYLLYDPVKKVIGNIHSGWKGTCKRIIEKSIDLMIKEYNSDINDILVFICPSIRKCHFEVDKDVKEMFENIFSFTKRLDEFIFKVPNQEKYLIDTVKLNNILLTNKGINVDNIFDCGLCSVCNKENINSYRAEGEGFKRATAIITLN